MTEIQLSDSILRLALDLQRLSANDEAQAVAILTDLEAELKQLLASGNLSTLAKSQVTQLINDAETIISGGYAKAGAVVDLQGVVGLVADNTAAAMQTVLNAAVAAPSAETLASVSKAILIDGSPAKAWWARQSEDTAFRFAAAVRQGVVNGETNERIVARIAGKSGFMEVARSNARTLVHSSIMTAANDARMATYRKNGKYADGVRWLSTLDSHTCLRCSALDGAAWDFDGKPIKGNTIKYVGLPPAHFSCRCVVSLIPKSLDSVLGTTGLDAQIAANSRRASKDGPVANTGFDAFLARQTAEFIANTLGKTRADMFTAGKLTLRQLVSGTGRPLTLKELAAR